MVKYQYLIIHHDDEVYGTNDLAVAESWVDADGSTVIDTETSEQITNGIGFPREEIPEMTHLFNEGNPYNADDDTDEG